ncbi:sulfide dehydrogenase beta subunit [Thermoplasma volcanium GSS1]|uniref:Probable dihydroorotate dehydrogenase B (NAD(+)), electron transfer subunit n=1 Tax=Thermoplasma volcanium (strain ATCC 51530 / DSM 4299 / JCM 9571 / NBRC 15438 / GSS1) TaxID=273116 RepID=PYRK_THEVO|nr:dihydroorotate dehydrogenase electron transfer subunit [Thermoplasma volcanium]Q979G5.1 RecName: Full=Probable dihydroorotate dehydrogenase B (NAD(+)), electron transfer subunit; AltName: Full=Dihydroorotate oxidase B, electron transfer subunit [Thermoplasma volcanium GSS1]BAB60338.1 sulfide dehydrogenase beta subunit [Thermoplasma volcanium GSS1]
MINLKIEENVKESQNVNTLYFNWDQDIRPGQFAMIWIPGYGEIPMSFSGLGRRKSITVKAYGSASRKLTELKAGDDLFLRGPYGNGFDVREGRKLLVGGGSGIVSLYPIADQETDALISAKTRDELIFKDRFPESRRFIATDDGSDGFHGFAHELLQRINIDSYEAIYVCGPEQMMYKVLQVLKGRKVFVQFSLERTMKCGIGICDSCSLGGKQVCKEGPVFNIEELIGNPEFGVYRTTYSGRRIRLNVK